MILQDRAYTAAQMDAINEFVKLAREEASDRGHCDEAEDMIRAVLRKINVGHPAINAATDYRDETARLLDWDEAAAAHLADAFIAGVDYASKMGNGGKEYRSGWGTSQPA